MKKLLLLTLLLGAFRASAVSFFDPFSDATASGGSSYAANSPLAVTQGTSQTNAMGVAWFCISNTYPTFLGVPIITNDNLSYPGMGTSSGNALFIPPSAGIMGRVSLTNGNYPFTGGISAGQVYYSFMLKVTDISTLTTTTTTNFFAGFTDTTGLAKALLARCQSYLVAKKSGAGYLLGIGKGTKPTATQIAYDTTVRNVGDTLFIVADYDYSTLTANLWINPGNLGAVSPPAVTVSQATGGELSGPIVGFVLGEYTNSTPPPPGCVIDDARVSTNWAIATGAPDIQTQPVASQAKNAGDAASIAVKATGAATLTYQWKLNGNNVTDGGGYSGSSSATLSITGASQATAGTYTLVIANGNGSVTSSPSILSVTDPYIGSQPSSVTLSPGQNATFSLTAQGAAPLSYQWYKGANLLSNTGNISGSTTSALTVSSIGLGDVGSYSCYVTNGLGSILQSATATLNVSDPAITSQPQNAAGNYGTSATFSVSAVGSSPITYQWFHGATSLSDIGNISGSQSAILTVNSMSYTDNGSYSVVVTSPGGTATSSAATLSVVEPIITSGPASTTATSTSNATFSVTAIGVAPFTYQWKKNNSNLSDTGNVSGSQTSALTLTAVSATDAASYTVLVGDASGTNVLSGAGVLTVLNPPTITAQPNSRRIVAGNKAVFAVSASGAAPLSYQWLLNGGTISGATSSSYSIANAQVSDDASYSVVVTNAVGAATSSVATLDVVASIRLYNTNIVVLRAGDGAQTQTLNGNSVFLDQYNQSGNYVSTVCIPDSGASALIEMGLDQNGSTLTGSALSHSGGDRYLVLAGYNTAAPYSANLQTSASATVPRAIGIVDTYGQYTLAVADTNAYNATYFRGAAFDGTNNFWGAGNAGGTYYFGLDAAAATIQTSFANLRSVDIFNGNLYTVSGSGTGTGILKWSGRPTTATAATTLFSPVPVPSDISVDTTGTNIYVGSSGGVLKYQFDGTTWTAVYTLATGAVRYIAVDYSGANPVIYATTTDSSFNRIVTVTDTGALSPVTTFATAGLNQTFRGIRLGPVETLVSITASPANKTGATGGSVVFSGTVVGDTPLSYQWYKGAVALSNGTTGSGSVISGATAANLTLSNLSTADEGSYSFVVSNPHSTATSSSGTLTVIDGVLITSGPISQTANYGANATFSVSASGGGTVSYQWKKGASNLSNGGNVSGATTSSLTLSGVAAGDADTYTVTVSNEANSTTASATLTVNDPAITSAPTAQTAECGSNAVFNVTAVGAGTLTYQWYENGLPLSDGGNVSGSTTTSLTLSGVTLGQSGNLYNVTVTGVQTATSSQVALIVTDTTPPLVTLNGPASITINCHDSFSDPGATANDSCAGPVAVTTNNTVNVDAAGDYTITYSAIDPSTNTGIATLVVHVLDGVPPVVTLNGPASDTVCMGTSYNDPGATANDACAGPLTPSVTTDLNTNVAGFYTLTYTAIDPSGNSNSVMRVVQVTNCAIAVAIVSQPNVIGATQPVPDGTNVQFTIGTTGSDPKIYQWYVKDFADGGVGTLVADATNDSPVISAVAIRRDLRIATNVYYVVVDNAANVPQTSSNIAVRITVDNKKPAIASVSSPKAGERIDSQSLVIMGKATDSSGGNVVKIVYNYTNHNPDSVSAMYTNDVPDTSGTPTSRTFTFPAETLPPGTNDISFWALDSAGNMSSKPYVVKKVFSRKAVTYTLTIAGDGGGTVTATTKGASHEPILGMPSPGTTGSIPITLYEFQVYQFIFTPDTKSTALISSVVSNAPSTAALPGTALVAGSDTTKRIIYNFTAGTSDTADTVYFNRNRTHYMAGTYIAVFTASTNNPTAASSRFMSMTLSKTGVASGYLLAADGHTRDSFSKVQFAANGSTNFTTPGGITISGNFDWANADDPNGVKEFEGHATDGNWVAEIDADRTDKAAISDGQATIEIPPISGGTDGSGFATVIAKNGTINTTYTLADDDKHSVKWTAVGTRSGRIPQWVATKSGGLFAGIMHVTNGLVTISDTNIWVRPPTGNTTYPTLLPGGFTSGLFACECSPFNPTPLLSGTFTLNLTGGGVISNVVNQSVTFTSGVLAPVGHITAGSVDANGKVKITFLDGLPSKHKTTAVGTFLQNANTGAGFFILPSATSPVNSGVMTLTP